MTQPVCLAVDGHDGSGKTTLALALAERLGAAYVRAFTGPAGAAFLSAAEGGLPAEAVEIAGTAVGAVLSAHQAERVLVFDRLWLTVLSVLPPDALGLWTFRPPCLLCWSGLETTLSRLAARSERQEPVGWHTHYLARYRALADEFDVPILRTDEHGPGEALAVAEAWARGALQAAGAARL